MTKTRIFLFATLALIVVFGQMALAADAPRTFANVLGPVPGLHPGLNPDVTPAAANTVIFATPDSGAPFGFCATGTSMDPCPNDPAGTMIIGVPEAAGFTAATCNTTTAPGCGVIFNFFASNTATGDWKYSIVVKQGTKTIQSSGLVDTKQTFPAGFTGASGFYMLFGPGNCPKAVTCSAAVAGPASVTYTNKIGTTTVVGHATIQLQ